MKKTAAAVLALALVGGAMPAANFVGLSMTDTAIVADAADADQSWFDVKTGTLHLNGIIENQVQVLTQVMLLIWLRCSLQDGLQTVQSRLR